LNYDQKLTPTLLDITNREIYLYKNYIL
jgi:hypothetical protein